MTNHSVTQSFIQPIIQSSNHSARKYAISFYIRLDISWLRNIQLIANERFGDYYSFQNPIRVYICDTYTHIDYPNTCFFLIASNDIDSTFMTYPV